MQGDREKGGSGEFGCNEGDESVGAATAASGMWSST